MSLRASAAGRVAIGVATGALAIGLQVLLVSRTPSSPFLLVYPAVILAAWWARWEAGAAAIVTSLVGLVYMLLPPTVAFQVALVRDAVDLGLFVAVSAVLVYIVDRTRRALTDACAARRIAEEAMAARDAMVAIVAHDLRNPMQTIGLNAGILDASLPAEDARSRSSIERLRRAAGRATRLVEGIEAVARVGAAPFPLQKAEWPLAAIVDDVFSAFEPTASTLGPRLVRPAPEALEGTVFCDRDRIVQVLTNLMRNSFQFTTVHGSVSLDVQRTPAGVRFEVTDTGAGMTEAELAHAFDRLWHGPHPGHGSGLGLWIARALVEAHGGRISPRSVVGQGTSMAFTLPLVESPPETNVSSRPMAPAFT